MCGRVPHIIFVSTYNSCSNGCGSSCSISCEPSSCTNWAAHIGDSCYPSSCSATESQTKNKKLI